MFVHMAMKAREQGPLGAGVTGVCEKQNVGSLKEQQYVPF